MKRMHFSLRARQDLTGIALYIADATGNRLTASRLTAQIRQRCHDIASLPGTLGRSRDELITGLRSIAYKSYVIFFRYQDDIVEVVTILHGMRDIDAVFDETD